MGIRKPEPPFQPLFECSTHSNVPVDLSFNAEEGHKYILDIKIGGANDLEIFIVDEAEPDKKLAQTFYVFQCR